MGLYLGETKIGNIYLGEIKIGKIYLGETLLYNSSSQPPVSEDLYLSDEDTVLNIGTGYDIPTTIYNIDTGTTSTTTTRLSAPLSISNLANSSSGDEYYYSPTLSGATTYNTLTKPSILGANSLTGAINNLNLSGSTNIANDYISGPYYYNQGSAQPHTLIGQSNGNYSASDIPSGQTLSLTLSWHSDSGSSLSCPSHTKLTFYATDTTENTTLATVSLEDIDLNKQWNLVLPSFTVPSGGFKLFAVVDRTLDTWDSAQNPYDSTWQHFSISKGSVTAKTVEYYYNTPIYCNIRRIQYVSEQDPSMNTDTVYVSPSPNDINSTKMISIDSNGVATLSDKE